VATHGAFLRGMNVGGRRVTTDDLRAHISALGLADVEIFRASGNVVLSAGRRSDARIAALIEAGLQRALGYPVAAFVRSAAEIAEIAARRPFDEERVAASTGKLHVALLPHAPGRERARETLALAGDSDLLAFGERELYWLPSGRMIDSALDLRALERLVGPWTMRTKSTIEQLWVRHLAR
jgi:uncharacterized protein (DUF1697 family)